MKNDIKRESLTSNLLNKVILRLDFLRIVDIQELVSELQKYLNTAGFFLTNEDFINDVELQINDPDVLSTDNFTVKKLTRREQVYIFESTDDTIELLISESCIIFNISCKENYRLKECMRIFCDIVMMAQDKFKFIKFTRIGLRKINNIICEDINLYYCFEKDFFPDLNIEQDKSQEIRYMRRQSIDNFIYNEHLFNVSKFIQEGILEDDTSRRAFNVVLDIDGYLKERIPEKFEDYTHIRNTIISINSNIFHIFKSMITENLLRDLAKGESSKVEWGLNIND